MSEATYRRVIVLIVVAALCVAGVAGAIIYALQDAAAMNARVYPDAVVCPSGTDPYAAYVGDPLSRSINVECFDPADAQTPIRPWG